uniref:ZP domain-containing protein n=1 Tax=Steinernema glaseri TaxID=37863 RepID=A0A1I7YKA0_9BILA
MFSRRSLLGLSALAVLIGIQSVLGFLIDNEIVADPVVDCEDTMIGLTFKTKKPFTGRIYVRGLADDDRCSRNFAMNTDQQKLGIMIQNGDCTMQRARVAGQLEGLMFSITIVVSFHGTFVTKADRAYRAMCFFRNVKRLTQGIDMDQIGTTELLDTAKMPSCSYTIHSGSADGPPLTLGQVGDKIFHVWECDETAKGYNFLVHSCWTDDGRGSRFDLLDIDGCAIDPVIQPDVVYELDHHRAYAETSGYKFSDTSVLNYQCVVELCKQSTGECEGLTPPTCGRRKKRALESSTRYPESHRVNEYNVNQVDVMASITMRDSAQMTEDNVAVNDPEVKQFDEIFFAPHENPDKLDTVGLHKVCIAQPTFALMLSAIAFLIVSSATAFVTLVYKFRSHKGSVSFAETPRA